MPIEPATFLGDPETKSGSVYPGVYVSLNLERRKLLATSSGDVVLTYNNPTAQVPPGIQDKDLVHLQAALERGDIVIGRMDPKPQAPRTIMEPIYEEVDKAESVEEIKPLVFRIASRQKHLGGLAPAEALRNLIAHESTIRCRGEILNFIGLVMDRTAGHSGVTEDLQELQRVRIPVDNEGRPAISEVPERTEEQKNVIRNLI